jgi:hypothetical protein
VEVRGDLEKGGGGEEKRIMENGNLRIYVGNVITKSDGVHDHVRGSSVLLCRQPRDAHQPQAVVTAGQMIREVDSGRRRPQRERAFSIFRLLCGPLGPLEDTSNVLKIVNIVLTYRTETLEPIRPPSIS